MSLGDLHFFMQELTGFDDDHPSTFYVANTWRGKRKHLMENEEWDINDPMWTKTLKRRELLVAQGAAELTDPRPRLELGTYGLTVNSSRPYSNVLFLKQ